MKRHLLILQTAKEKKRKEKKSKTHAFRTLG
jgi:hypothetical protein